MPTADRGIIGAMQLQAPFNSDLLARYDKAGPRYTSYPTAPNFTPEFGARQFVEVARSTGSETPSRALSLYLHVPFCYSPCLYCGCNRVISRSAERAAGYVKRLLAEIDLVGHLFAGRAIAQIHFGGGTPNVLSATQIEQLLQAVQRTFQFSPGPGCELSMEVDPRFVPAGYVPELAMLGFNRLSLGVQDFDPDVQAAINRAQSPEQTLAAMEAARQAGIGSINVDLMYGLPRQTPESFRTTLRTVIDARPARLAVYGYAHMPALFKAQRRIREDELPDARTRVALLATAISTLTGAGYEYIGMDHFALPEDGLAQARRNGTLQRNFMGYTERGGADLLGFGVSAISHLGDTFSQNPRDLRDWEAAIDAGRLPVWRGLRLDADYIIRAEVITQIMCRGDANITELENRYGIDFWTVFAGAREKLRPLEADGLVWTCASHVMASEPGRYLLRAIAACFDRHLPSDSQEPGAPQFSKVL